MLTIPHRNKGSLPILWAIALVLPFARAQNWNFLGVADKGQARALAGNDTVLPALGTKAPLTPVSSQRAAAYW